MLAARWTTCDLVRYCRGRLAQADAGADLVAPADEDGQVRAIRRALDGAARADRHPRLRGEVRLELLRPFRDAVDVQIAGGGNRRAYQQDPANAREALAEVALDVAEGATS